MGNGTKVNKPCWCGSGIKYKFCHLKKEYEEKVKIHEIEKDLRQGFAKKRCMVPSEFKEECTKKIIKAHTISKSSNLKQISENGHVLGFDKSILALNKNNGKFPIKEIGINNASIFNGFCSKHDKELFSIIENSDMVFTNEQIFILSYRAMCQELYLKYNSSELHKKQLNYDKGLSPESQYMMQMSMKIFEDGTKTAINDL